jgi:hypothetical protein
VTTEFILLLGLYAFILLGAFLGEKGPVATFKSAGPRLAAKVEKDISIGKDWKNAAGQSTMFLDPDGP